MRMKPTTSKEKFIKIARQQVTILKLKQKFPRAGDTHRLLLWDLILVWLPALELFGLTAKIAGKIRKTISTFLESASAFRVSKFLRKLSSPFSKTFFGTLMIELFS